MAFYDCKRLSHTILVRDHMELDLQELIWLDVYYAASVSVDQRDFIGFSIYFAVRLSHLLFLKRCLRGLA